MLNKSITSLAILKANWDERKIDYIETFVPFFSNLIRAKAYKKIDVDTIRKDFMDEYGLVIPRHPIMAILGRLKLRGFISKTPEGFVPINSKINDGNFDVISGEQKRKLNKLIAAIIEFAKNNYDIDLTEEVAEKALLGFFKESELGILYATDNLEVVPDVETEKSTRFIVAKFIYSAQKSEPQLFEFISAIAIGNALAATIAYGSGLTEHFSGRMKSLNLYLDTGYLFALLGVDGEDNKGAFEELTENLIKDGAKLKVFEHTYDEMMTIFNGALYWMDQKNYDPAKASRTLRYFITHEFTASDVEMFIAKVPQVLERFKIEKVQKPSYDKDIKYQIDESQLRELILEAYRTDPFFDETQKEETINKDIESVYSICKLRRGKVAFTLHDASHIFITRNKSLAKLSNKVQATEAVPLSIPPCVTDIFIGTLLWLQNPTVTTELNEKRIIADAYAAIQPDSQLIKKYLDQIEALKKEGEISDNQYYVLRTHRVAFNLLSETTKNDIDNFGSKTTTQILDEINREHISLLKSEVEQEKASHKKTIEALADKEQTIQQKDEQMDIFKKKYEKLLSFIANTLTWVIFPIVIALIPIALIITTFPSFTSSLLVKIIAFIIICLITLLGFSIKNTRSWLNDKIKNLIIKKFLEK